MPRLWDDSLYEGSAVHYLAGRLPYPPRLADTFLQVCDLDGSGRLLDLGCGPGSLTLVLAPLFGDVVAVDADADMIRVATAEAARQGIGNVTWRHAYAEDLEAGVGSFQVVTLAQSFHWMDRPVVAGRIKQWLQPGGTCVHVGATTHQGTGAADLAHPPPPRERITELVQSYLGKERRAGQQVVAGRSTPSQEEVVFRAAGLVGPEVVLVRGGDVFERSEEEVVASVLSLSSAAPHLFADRLADFVADLRRLLRTVSPTGRFSEQLGDLRLFLYRR